MCIKKRDIIYFHRTRFENRFITIMNTNNKIGIVSVSELQGLDFIIPDYQRGYRWEDLQIIELLKDITNFIDAGRSGFYCLQPLVVKRSLLNIDSFYETIKGRLDEVQNEPDPVGCLLADLQKMTTWEVIDGQQRLTTLYIIMMVLKQDPAYSISYQTRFGSKDFLEHVMEKSAEDGDENIDYMHMLGARDVAEAWLKDRTKEQKAMLYDTILERVKFIWYESVGENAIDVFTRLNIGKISLTNAELIKAALLNRSNYVGAHTDYIHTKQIQISSKWDEIEYALQDDELWLFLNDKDYHERTRIDFLFKVLFENDCFALKTKMTPEEYDSQIGHDRYSVYRYFAKQIESFDENCDKAEHLDDIWQKVTSLYDTICEWFEDSLIYHYIGFCIWAKEDDRDGVESRRKQINTWYNQWMASEDKDTFLEIVKSAIRQNIINCKEENLNNLHFEKNKSKIRKILLLHNIQTIIVQQEVQEDKYKLASFQKFPFHLFKRETWNVEHIDSATTNELESVKEKKTWLRAALASGKLKFDEKIKKYLDKRCKDIPDFQEIYDNVMDNFISDDILLESVQKGDEEDNERMHIWNLALLDEGTNKSYHNSIFSVKRSFVINKEQGKHCYISDEGKVEIDGKSIAFVPICTKQVFLKYYTDNANALLAWTRSDSNEYLADIKNKLKDFLL